MSRYVSRSPTPDTPPTVLIGPTGLSAGCWGELGLDGQALDYPGHGDRPLQPGWTHTTYAEELADTFDGQIDVLAVSDGVVSALQLLARAPDKVRSAVLIGVGGGVASTALPLGEGDDTALEQRFTPQAWRRQTAPVQLARQSLASLRMESHADARAASVNTRPIDDPTLRGIATPVSIIGGLFDRVAGLAGARHMHEVLRNSRLEIMPLPHFAHFESPESVNTVLDRHRVWAPIGNRVDAPLGSGVWLHERDMVQQQ